MLSFIYIVVVFEFNNRVLETIPLIFQQFSEKIVLPVNILNFATLISADLVSDWLFKYKIKLPETKDNRIVVEFIYRLFVTPGALVFIECVLVWIFIIWSFVQIYLPLLSSH